MRRELETLLFFEKDRSFLEETAVAEIGGMIEGDRIIDQSLTGKFAGGTILDGRYEIIRLLGKGGMGAVYLAQDKKLDRLVGIKFLSGELGLDDQKLNRFIQEAKAASALNHPNIITVFEIREHEGTHFIVAEFIEGETLGARLKREKPALMTALDIAIQITSALTAAHEAGIIHRDLKPDNVMIRKDGIVKVLDFGLAKPVAKNSGENVDKEAPTIARVMTLPGMVIGTPQYMSPEQARGRPVDTRTDIFSLGVVIFEMVTGHQPFEGDNPLDIIGSILKDEPPPLENFSTDVPAELEHIVSKTLRKNPEKRYQNIKDLLIDLKDLKDDLKFEKKLSHNTDAPGRIHPTSENAASLIMGRRFSFIHLGGFLLFVIMAVLSVWWWIGNVSKEPRAAAPGALKSVDIFSWSSAPRELYTGAVFSPDGKMIAFASTKSGTKGIWVKQTSSGEAICITKEDFDNESPLWSPDGSEISFYSNRGDFSGIWRVPALGGSPKPIARTNNIGTQLRRWSKSGKIYFESDHNLYAVNERSGKIDQITEFDPKNSKEKLISISPDEKLIAFVVTEEKSSKILVTHLDGTPEPETLLDTRNEINSLVWRQDGKGILFSQLTDGVFQVFEAGLAGGNPGQITFGDRDSTVQDVSADGSRILFGSATENSDIWRVSLKDSKEAVIAADLTSELWPDVSPDNERVVFQSVKNLSLGNKLLNSSILLKTPSVDGGSSPQQLAEDGFLPLWSFDGQNIAFYKLVDKEVELWRVSPTGSDAKRLTSGGLRVIGFSVSPYTRIQANYISWSPKSDSLAYVAERESRSNLWLVSADGESDRRLTENGDDNLSFFCPVWSSDGRRIAFFSQPKKQKAEGAEAFHLGVFDLETGETKTVYATNDMIRLLGWSEREDELVFAFSKKAFSSLPPEVEIYNVSVETGRKRLVNTLKEAYYYNIHLSPDRKLIGFTSRAAKNDDVWIVPSTGGQPRRLTRNNDPRLYFSSISWTPNGEAIYFGKQSRFNLISMIEHEKNGENK